MSAAERRALQAAEREARLYQRQCLREERAAAERSSKQHEGEEHEVEDAVEDEVEDEVEDAVEDEPVVMSSAAEVFEAATLLMAVQDSVAVSGEADVGEEETTEEPVAEVGEEETIEEPVAEVGEEEISEEPVAEVGEEGTTEEPVAEVGESDTTENVSSGNVGISISGQVKVKVEQVDIEEDAWVFEQVTGQKAERGAEGGEEGGAGGGLGTSVAVSGSEKKKTTKKPRTKTPKGKGTKKPKGAADDASETSSPSPRRSARRVVGQIFMPAFFKKHVSKESDSD